MGQRSQLPREYKQPRLAYKRGFEHDDSDLVEGRMESHSKQMFYFPTLIDDANKLYDDTITLASL